MKVPGRKVLAWLAAGLAAVAVVSVLVARAWVVPAVLASRIGAAAGGKAEIGNWWLNGRSAGVTALKIHEGPGAGSPVWASAERVTTDLSIGGLLRGRFMPRRVTVDGPAVSLKFDARGNLLTKLGPASGSGGAPAGPIPVVVAKGARLTLQQEGRPALTVNGVTGRVGSVQEEKRTLILLAARSNDPNWGPLEVHGNLDPAFKNGRIEMKTMSGVKATPEKAKAIPFVPADVWKNVAPRGEVDVVLNVTLDKGAAHTRTTITLRDTDARSDALDLSASRARGQVIVDDAVVTFHDVSGRAIDGRVTANGKADFSQTPPRFDLRLKLDGINVADAPKSWQLDEAGLTGHLSGDVRLLALLKPDGVDLSGTSGEAVVEGGTIQGIPFKSLKLVMSASGGDLRYDTPKSTTLAPGFSPGGLAALALVALQNPEASVAKPKPAKPSITLPKSITTHLELEDVELSQLIQRAKLLMGFPFPVPITGRLSLKADATIPLGRLENIKGYAFHGDLTLARASVYKVDLGQVSARVDLEDGVLDLKDLRGRLVDDPNGGPDNPPPAEGGEVPATGPLPPGAFRGSLHAAIAPPGKLTARFEGNQLPLGELAAPALPRPTPLSGLANLNVEAESDLSRATDPAAWTASGTAESRLIHYKGAALDGVAVRFALKDGRLDVPELTALLRDRPLRARAALDLKPPQAFQGVVDVAGWDVNEVLAWVPGAPRPAPVAGNLSARAEATGTLSPFAFKTEGRGSFERFQAGPVSLGAVPFQWTTRGDSVAFAVTDAHPFGGRVTAEAVIPLSPGKPVVGSATLDAIDAAALSEAIPGRSLKLTGRAGGKVTFSVPPDVSGLEADVRIAAPDLTVQGVPAEQVRAAVKAQKGVLRYEVSADSLGGVIRFNGEFPLAAAPIAHEADGELRAVGFTLDRLWKALGVSHGALKLNGEGAIDANVRAILGGRTAGLYAHGIAEVRALRWGDSASLGRLRAIVMLTPDAWRVDPISGELLGGAAGGFLWGTGTATAPDGDPGKREVGFDLRVSRAGLRDAAAFIPIKGLNVQGFADLRLVGTAGESLRASGEVYVPSARVAGLPVSGLRIPAELATTGGLGSGVVHVRHYAGRVAGGSAHGDAWFHLGNDRAFQGDVVLSGVDLESVTRIETEARRPASGKISGRVSLSGTDPAEPRTYRGRVALELTDASLVALPVFRELDRFLGSARGGLFEAGELTGAVANRQLVIESATLQGRLAQLHISGTVGFDSQLNLEVLVNTNQIIPQTGAALVAAIPGLRGAAGRSREASLQVNNYLSNKLLKLRVTGTLRNPTVNLDPGIAVAEGAMGFFTGVLKLPLGLVK